MEHLGPQRRRLRAVGADEVVEQARGRVLKQAVPERLEALDDLFDQRPGACAVAGLAHRVAYLFDSGTKPYTRHPELIELIPLELYERGRQLATRLVEQVSPTSLLHGDLTPSNILNGGNERGLVAIDPAPCLGDDLAFEAVDLLLWQADDVDVIAARAEQLAPALDVDASRMLDWCTAFAAMTALELAEAPNYSPERIQAAVTLASHARTRQA